MKEPSAPLSCSHPQRDCFLSVFSKPFLCVLQTSVRRSVLFSPHEHLPMSLNLTVNPILSGCILGGTLPAPHRLLRPPLLGFPWGPSWGG